MMEMVYDLIILGGGPAGLSAGIYAGRSLLNTLIIDKGEPGGQLLTTTDIVNYPGMIKIDGNTLSNKLFEHARNFGVEYVNAQIKKIDFSGDVKKLFSRNKEFHARSIIIATGASPRKIGFTGEAEFAGRGVSYCATCDGAFFAGMDIFVVGGGYAAAEEALFLTKFGRKITMLIRRNVFSCAKSLEMQVRNHPKIEVMFHTEIEKCEGDFALRSLILKNNQTGEFSVYTPPEKDGMFGIFVFAGSVPATELIKDVITLDENGFVITDSNSLETSIPGVYAAGDLRQKQLRQIVTAVSDGAIAASAAEKYMAGIKLMLENE